MVQSCEDASSSPRPLRPATAVSNCIRRTFAVAKPGSPVELMICGAIGWMDDGFQLAKSSSQVAQQ